MAGTVEFWYRRKYSLTPNDPRFLDLSIDDILAEFWAHNYADNPNAAREEFENDDFADDLAAFMSEENDPENWEDI